MSSSENVQKILEEGRPLERISALETGQEQMAREIVSVNRSIDRLAVETREGLSQLSDKISAVQKTNWPTLIGLSTIALIVFGGVFGIIVRDNARLEYGFKELVKDYAAHVTSNGHHGVGENEKRIEKLDEVLQREMRLLDIQTQTKLEELDIRLQREMSLMDENIKIRVNYLEKETDILRGR